jgi:uncharacterized protein
MRGSLEKLLEDVETVLVTGGSSGIGECFIRQLSTLKSTLVFGNISRSKPERFPSNFPMLHIACDLGKPDQLEKAAAAAERLARERPGKILLINNSGFGAYGPFPAPELDHHLDMLEVNVKAPVHLTGLLLPLLRERGGYVINVASTAAFQPTPYLATYGASKAFLLHWSLGLSEDLRGSGVRVMALCPGPTSTRFFTRAGFSEPIVSDRMGQTAEQVVDAALRGLAAGKNLVISGRINRLLAAASIGMPKPLAARISAAVLKRFRLEKLEKK